MIFSHRLYFIRHGETDWNLEGRLQGRNDRPLNARGEIQAAEAARRFARLSRPGRPGFEDLRFIASPLLRCRRTMDLARGALGLPVAGYEHDERLVELAFGAWEGLTWGEVQARAPGIEEVRNAGLWSFVPPGGESYEIAAARVGAFLADLDGDAVVVSHGGVARLMMILIGGIARERALTTLVAQGRVLVFSGGACRWV